MLRSLLTRARSALVSHVQRHPGGRLERHLAVVNVTPRRCGLCVHWDRAGGQAVMNSDPIFSRLMALSPDELGRARKGELPSFGTEDVHDETGAVVQPALGHRGLRAGKLHTWEQYGACTYLQILTHEDNTTATVRDADGTERIVSCPSWNGR